MRIVPTALPGVLIVEPDVHADGVRAFAEAGFDEVYVGQVGGATDEFFGFCADNLLPRLRGA